MDYIALATALAARYDPANVTPPAGYDNIRVSTFKLPNQMTPLPTVLIFAEAGDFDTRSGDRQGGQDWLVRFYYDQVGDLPRAQEALLRWLPVLTDQLKTSVQLGGIVGLNYVRTMSWRIGTLRYGGEDYMGIELSVRAAVAEGWAAVA